MKGGLPRRLMVFIDQTPMREKVQLGVGCEWHNIVRALGAESSIRSVVTPL
jgi:hypothetical protein